jgi:hypothetical protein
VLPLLHAPETEKTFQIEMNGTRRGGWGGTWRRALRRGSGREDIASLDMEAVAADDGDEMEMSME